MKLVPGDGTTVDMQALFRRLFNDTSTEFVFGKSLNTLKNPAGERFIEAYNRALKKAGERIRAVSFKNQLLNYLPTFDKAWLADIKIVHDYIDTCIANHRSSSDAASKKNANYVLIDEMSKAFPDPVALRYQLLAVHVLARDTAAMGISNTLWELARNTEVWTRLREQALQLSEEDILDSEKLRNLTYFRYVALEGLRLHLPITRGRRIARRDTVLSRGGGPDGSQPAFVPKGTYVWVDKYPMTRDPSICRYPTPPHDTHSC